MATIAENLQTLIEQKAAIKAALENQNKSPTDQLSTYAGLIDTLENPDEISYCVTVDGTNKAYAQLHGQEKVTLTATANDVRLGTSVISSEGYMEGEKDIPAYHTTTGVRLIPANAELKISLSNGDLYDYTELQAMTMPFNSSMDESMAVDRTVIKNKVYNVGSTNVVANVTIDDANKAISLGITNGSTPAVIRFFTYKEEA